MSLSSPAVPKPYQPKGTLLIYFKHSTPDMRIWENSDKIKIKIKINFNEELAVQRLFCNILTEQGRHLFNQMIPQSEVE